MKKSVYSLLIVLVSMAKGPVFAGSPKALKDVVQTVLSRHPALMASAAKEVQAKSEVKEVKALNWPNLSLQSSVTRGDNPVYVFGSLLQQKKFGPQNFAIDSLNNPDALTNYKNAVVLGIPVFTGFELDSSHKMAQIQFNQSQKQLESTAQAIRLQTIEAYLQVLLQKNLLRSLEERIASSEIEVESSRKLNARGLVLGSDYYAAQAVLSGLEMQKLQTQKMFEGAIEQLAVLSGIPAEDLHVTGILADRRYQINESSALVHQALINRPDFTLAVEQTKLAHVAYEQTGRQLWPRVDAYASLETNTEDFSSNPSQHMVGVQATVPIGNPAYGSRRNKAKAQMDQAMGFKNSTQDQIRIDIAKSLKSYQAAADSLDKAKDMLNKAEKSLELFRPLYREGRQSIIDVLRAEEGLMRAQATYAGTLTQLHMGYAQIQYALGLLDDNAVNTINQHLEVQ